MLFLHNTSRVDGEPYPTLLRDKGFGGFPSLCFMDADGNVLAKPGRSIAAFRETHARVQQLVALRGKSGRSAADEKELFLLELQLDLVPVGEIQARADKVPSLGKAGRELVAQKIVDGEVAAIIADARAAGPEATGDQLVAIAKAGRKPSPAMAGRFWAQVLAAASRQRDQPLAQQAYEALLVTYQDEKGPQFERAKEAWQKLLAEAAGK